MPDNTDSFLTSDDFMDAIQIYNYCTMTYAKAEKSRLRKMFISDNVKRHMLTSHQILVDLKDVETFRNILNKEGLSDCEIKMRQEQLALLMESFKENKADRLIQRFSEFKNEHDKRVANHIPIQPESAPALSNEYGDSLQDRCEKVERARNNIGNAFDSLHIKGKVLQKGLEPLSPSYDPVQEKPNKRKLT